MTISIEERFHKFIVKVLNPKEDEKERIKSKTKKLNNMMRNNTGIAIAETLYGGSFAKATMLKGRNEADVVFVLSNKYPDKELDEIKEDLEIFFNNISNITNVEPNYRALSFNYDGVDIDLLLAKSVKSPNSYKNMPEKQKKRYFGSSAKYHVDFVNKKSSKYKDLVRVLKYWIQQYPSKIKLCSSFMLELIASIVYEENEEEKIPELFENAISWIVESKLEVYIEFSFRDDYEVKKYKKVEAFIADPGDPSNNVLDGINNKEQLIEYAKNTQNRIKKGNWNEIFRNNFPNEEGVQRKKAKKRERKSQHPSDAPNRRYG